MTIPPVALVPVTPPVAWAPVFPPASGFVRHLSQNLYLVIASQHRRRQSAGHSSASNDRYEGPRRRECMALSILCGGITDFRCLGQIG